MVNEFLRGHGEFRREYLASSREFIERLASRDQSPGALYIGCSDSRVVPELLTSSTPGQLFVVRNVANLVPPFKHAYVSVGAALEYATEVLNVPNIIICGHYGCGGVRAMVDPDARLEGLPSLARWLQEAGAALAVGRRTDLDLAARWQRGVEENVLDGLANLASYPNVVGRLEAGTLALHGWIYDLGTGHVRVLDVARGAFIDAAAVVG